MAKVMLSQCDTPSKLRDMETFTARDICDLAREGEEMAASIVDRCGDYLGRAMSFVSCTTDPDVFVVGGGMSRAGAVVTDAVAKYFRKYAFHVSTNTPIVIATLGNDAGIYGSARMVLS
jgi:glucokinase